ncbi:MAG: CHASE2 domain-containing protein, partial [Caldiserica bacterium]|nr:CHASE2 domain-containing protein [Caldisericota bacterium]
DHRVLNFYGPPGSITTIPYHVAATDGAPDAGLNLPDLTGKVVFVGFSDLYDPGQPDRFYTVFTNADGVDLSGVEIAATAFGNLLTQEFEDVWYSRPAKYFRRKEFLPPKCKTCEYATKCMGACPLYWDNMGSFNELPGSDNPLKDFAWKTRRKMIGKCKPVPGVAK